MAAEFKQDPGVVHVLLEKDKDEVIIKEEAGKQPGGGDEEGEDRAKWGSQREYFLSTIGYCVGVGNVLRFPYICNKNGGGAFLLPFLVCLLVIGMPMFFLETTLGQFRGKSPLHIWSICPILKGIGITTGLLSTIVYWYYSVILTWSVYYLVSSFQTTLPWTRCDGWWNTPKCRIFAEPLNDTSLLSGNLTSHDNMTAADDNATAVFGNVASLRNVALLNGTASNLTINVNKSDPDDFVTAAEEFWQHNVLQISDGLYEPGEVVWYLAVAQIVVMLFTFLALSKGIKSSGKVVYVTAIAPYVLLTVLLVRSVTLPGAREGILFYITPDFSRLLDYNIWIEAALQVFYSLAIAWGVCQTLSSFNQFNNNHLRDSIMITLIGEGTSVYAGFAVFSVLGYLAHQSSVPVNEVVSSGPGLAFVVYPEALSLMPLSQLWAVLFFLMLITVVFDTEMATGETLFTIISDHYPRLIRRYGLLIRALTSAVIFLTSLILVTKGGMYVFQLVDWYIGSFTTTMIALIECIVIGWVYGADRFGEDIQLMIGRKPPMIMKIQWCFILPVCFTVLLISTMASYEPPTYGDYHYDTLARVMGWMIATTSFIPIPAIGLVQLCRAKGTLLQRLKKVSRPDGEWGPSDPSLYSIYIAKMAARPPRQSWLDVLRR